MRAFVLAAAALAFVAGLVLDPAGVVRMARFGAAGGFGVPGRAVLLGVGGAAAAAAALAVLRRRAARRAAVAARGPRPRPMRPPQMRPPSSKLAKAPAPRPARAAARPASPARRKT